jgi:predicted N-acyltransferase
MGDIEQQPITVKVIDGITKIDAGQWDACAGGDNPFVSHAFLTALEHSGSAAPKTGWAPYHLVIEDDAGALKGAVPMYLKSHSYGEYVFDHAWAHAFERAGGDYYPKLQVSVPFTPATGPRLLVRPAPDAARVREALIAGSTAFARQAEVSSVHVTFCSEDEWRQLGAAGFLLRNDQQFHWENQGFGDFDDFLACLASRKRKAIRKERREALENGIRIEILTGGDIGEEHWDAFYHFYMDTGSRKWGSPYLNREFFSLLGETMADKVALVMCSRDGRYIAGALNLIGADALYGRNWGCIEDHRFLHFEACYYRAIDFAIERGLARVEAGAQGQHKLSRGYLPIKTYSAHWVRDPNLRRALEDYLVHERREVDFDVKLLGAHSPFRQEDDDGTMA